ncbi:guanine nucleotide-binding protein [Tricholoma matsutake]|nr:guanine nucleotide-binding protein [Tricholoma matsutake 945]
MRTPSLYSQDDPISAALKPSPSETEAERSARLVREVDAKRVSEQIDEDLRLERERLKRRKGDVKLLLLGQAESGKSTLQKQFQLMYKPSTIDQERISWKTVIYFNVIRTLKHILATLEAWDDSLDDELEQAADDTASINPTKTRINGISDQPSPSTSLLNSASVPSITGSPGRASPTPSPANASKEASVAQIAYLRRKLLSLVSFDAQLADRLSGGITVSGSGKGGVYVRSGWQARTIENALGRLKHRQSSHDEAAKKASTSHDVAPDPLVEEVGRMLTVSKDDIKELWSHPTVKGLIARRKLKLDEWSEFFLRHISRIAAPDYIPTTDDILHARIQTMGVAEHVFDLNIHGKAVSWHLFDVGGARGQRHSWVPYFDDANAIIFVAPVSAFDQYLEEDPRTNRIDDSLQLFTQICSNALLKNVHLVLFLNKTDLLKAKLDSGLKVRKYITSFGDRSNDYETVVQYFRAHFLQVHRRNNENRRVLYTHFTNVVDTKTTQRIIGNVRDSIFRGYLQSAALV